MATFTTAFAGIKYDIPMMDLKNEAGPNGTHVGGLCLAGKKYWASLCVKTPSRVTIPLGGGAVSLSAVSGVDCRNEVDEPATFRIVAPDGKVMWEKAGVKKGVRLEAKVDLTGFESVVLEVSGADGIMAGWAFGTVFEYADGKYPPNDVRMHTPQLGILTPPESAKPRINGPVVYGVRPGHPIIYRVPVTGQRPMKVKVESEKLRVESGKKAAGSAKSEAGSAKAAQLHFNPETHVLTGSIKEPGEYRLTFTAENAKGRDRRDFTIKVGDKISLTPAMGWNSWNCFSWNVTAADVRNAADAFEKTGLAEHGWSYVNIDDFWQNKPKSWMKDLHGPVRDENGKINTNKRFPDMKGLVDYLHAKGFKAGIYSSPGPTTCGGCEGSWQHEAQDASTYAEWGFDYLKHDWCSYGDVATGEGQERAMRPYRIMGDALKAQNRDILFSLCQYGKDDVGSWGVKVGGQSWRTTGDVFDRWSSIANGIKILKSQWHHAEPGGWNDPDMLCVGPMCWNEFKGSRLAPNEQYTHISLWALAAAPLMIGCDMTKLDDFTLSLLRNDEVIAIDQDPLGKAAACIVDKGGYDVWARPLADGSIAVGLLNYGLEEREIAFDIAAAGMEGAWKVRDCWRQKDEGTAKGVYKARVYGHATHLVRFIPGKDAKLRVADIREGR
ncbi:MAG: NPCBM/NEW2 domain-containing protein [Kiritimatiellae bacterium]|nr:NPCBM/NEW2 domain-containing protein [Kiritimatiellia bacterium]